MSDIDSKNSSKKNIGILFGGRSGEHEISIISAFSVAKALNPNKYDVTMIGIDKSGKWVLPSKQDLLKYEKSPRQLNLKNENLKFEILPYESSSSKKFDVILPILHGTYGEDGTIQGFLELVDIPYVGSGVLGSATGMDKDVAKRLFQSVGLKVVPWITLRSFDFNQNPQKSIKEIETQLSYPFFVKPANMGSSVGVHKIKSKDEALEKIKDAFLYDTKILAEKFIPARELEVAVLGNHEPKASIVGEIIPTHEFYSYESKYLDENGAHLKIPAENLSNDQVAKIQSMALQAFQSLECRGMARVDFFMDKNTSEIYLNEINTIPGFTSISMYPKLWQATGVPYTELLDKLIALAQEHHAEKSSLKRSFEI